jgi:hypothetical protein
MLQKNSPDLRVRMGIHEGKPSEKRNPVTGRMDYFGPCVNLAARVGDACHGGQILVTAVIEALIQKESSQEKSIKAAKPKAEGKAEGKAELQPLFVVSSPFYDLSLVRTMERFFICHHCHHCRWHTAHVLSSLGHCQVN